MTTHVAPQPKEDIWVELTRRTNGDLTFRVSCTPGVGKYFEDPEFNLKYDENIESVDDSILYIPLLANIAPVSWAAGANIHVKTLDETFLASLRTIKGFMKEMYPGFSFAGEIRVDEVVPNCFGHKGAAQLFSGGVDSMATYARHRGEKPGLITFGVFTPFSDTLQRAIFQELSRFAQQEGVDLHRVESNLNYTFFNHRKLYSDFSHCLYGQSWWASIQHGLGLLGICAPLTAVSDIQRIYIASSASKDKSMALWRPWGSHPLIDGNVAWADVKVCHDGVEWSRQEKIRLAIRPYIDDTKSHPRLIVCNDTRRGDVLNCSRCEKCCRTIVGLALEGIDPNLCGFKVDGRTFNDIRKKLLLRHLRFTSMKTGLWRDIQGGIPDAITDDLYGSKAFFQWLKAYEVPEDQGKYRPLSQKILDKCLRLGIIH